MIEVSVEMTDFRMFQNEENGTIKGHFTLDKYGSVTVKYMIKKGNVLFKNGFEGEKSKELFKSWLTREQDMYKTFILNYVNNITQINDISSFEGTLKQESCKFYEGNKLYILKINYKDIPGLIKFIFNTVTKEIDVLYYTIIPTNSRKICQNPHYIQHMLSEETIQRMWEPFRDKTKFRLPLLNELR